MFDSIGWGEIMVLVIAGLFILGPERLPGAAAWLGQTIRQVKDYATGARDQLQGELGLAHARIADQQQPDREHLEKHAVQGDLTRQAFTKEMP